ncbi:MAG TPA: APC family permease [Chloroflexota bacterium]|nr:APC family permease [Chloroflexota bacterium]
MSKTLAQSKPLSQAVAGQGTSAAEQTGSRLIKSIRWWDGCVLGLAVPGFLFPSLGFSVAALGAFGAIVVWLVSVVLGAVQNNIYAELAAMFPDKSGGIGIYAHEGIKRYSPIVGPLATWGYWLAWSSVLSINGLIIGDYLQSTVWPTATWTYFPPLIGTVAVLALWGLNVLGLRLSTRFSYLLGVLTLLPMLLVMVGPFLNGSLNYDNLKPLSLPDASLMLYWLYLAGWSAYGAECNATFGPEFAYTTREAPRALRVSSVFSIFVYGLVPLGLVGVLGTKGVAANQLTAFDPALRAIIGSDTNLVIVVIVLATLILAANVALIVGTRSLWQMSEENLAPAWLGPLGKYGVPNRAMAATVVPQIILMWLFPTSPVAILIAGNLGYLLCHVCALVAFILLRRDQPNATRPIRLGSSWVTIAGALVAVNVLFVIVGNVVGISINGFNSLIIGVALLGVGYVLYLARDRARA